MDLSLMKQFQNMNKKVFYNNIFMKWKKDKMMTKNKFNKKLKK